MFLNVLNRSLIAALLFLGVAGASIGTAEAHGPGKNGWRSHGHHSHHVHHHHKHKHWKHKRAGYRHYDRTDYRPVRNHDRHTRYRTNGAFNIGTLIGGVAGGVIGNQIGDGRGKVLATVGGALLGGIVGNAVYQDIQARDESQINNALETVPTGRSVAWTNPDTGNRFEVQPTRTYKSAAQQDCRDYTTWVFIDGYEKKVNGTACRTPSGRWQLVSR